MIFNPEIRRELRRLNIRLYIHARGCVFEKKFSKRRACIDAELFITVVENVLRGTRKYKNKNIYTRTPNKRRRKRTGVRVFPQRESYRTKRINLPGQPTYASF